MNLLVKYLVKKYKTPKGRRTKEITPTPKPTKPNSIGIVGSSGSSK
jgi:hypothetical protein